MGEHFDDRDDQEYRWDDPDADAIWFSGDLVTEEEVMEAWTDGACADWY